MLNKLRKCCCCLRGNRLTGQWSALTRVSTNLPYRIETNLSRRSYQTYFARLPNLRGAMSLSRWQRTVCSRSLLLFARVRQDEGDVEAHPSILMLIARWLIKKWTLGMLWSQPWWVSLPQRSSLSWTRHARNWIGSETNVPLIQRLSRSCLLCS